jgi:glyoxylase-like metal-dependent hydrolase (beta-lactamase superfamily II)
MRRALNWMGFVLFSAAALLFLLLLLAGVSLRAKRHEAGVPTQVTSRVVSVRNFVSNIYAARIGAKVILFDAGMDPEAHAVEQLVDALGADLGAVSDIFLTHGHFDHVAAALRCPRAKIHIGAGDADVLAHRNVSRALVPRLFGTLLSVPAIEASHRLVGSADIDVGNGESVLAVPLPGHTPGSYAYLFDGVLFTGDALFIGDDGLELAEPDEPALGASACRSIAQINDLFRRHRVNEICTGHRGCTAPEEASRVLERLTLGPGWSCPG